MAAQLFRETSGGQNSALVRVKSFVQGGRTFAYLSPYMKQRFWLFVIGMTLLKLCLMGMCSSDYETKMFMPFVRSFLEHPSVNPYDAFLSAHGFVAFPYPPLMLVIESIGGLIASVAAGHLFFERLLFKLPLLLFDYLGMYFLMQLYPHRRKYIGILYFGSPMILYATYVHGQLDIIPTSLLLGAIAFLFRRGSFHLWKVAALLAASLLTKFHILAAVPLLLLYLWDKVGAKKVLGVGCMVFLLVAAAVAPVSDAAFWQGTLLNKEQGLLTEVYWRFVDMHFYLPVFALLLVYLQAYLHIRMNQDLFLSFCGLLFGVFVICLPPMPGWYVWIVPFLTVFFLQAMDNKYRNLYIYAGFNVLYWLYFLTAHHSVYVDTYFFSEDLSFLKLDSETYRSVVFTCMDGMLGFLVYELYQYGISSNLFYRRKGRPFAIGISGDSGTGKSTLLSLLTYLFGKSHVLLIEGDGDHKWERGANEWHTYTHLNPKANYLYRQAKDIVRLKRGMTVERVEYDHATGGFTAPRRVHPHKYIIISGLHAFYLPQMRQILDLKIYMDTDETLRRYWKVKRDTAKRGYSFDQILQQIEARVPDTEKYIVPQRRFADLEIRYYDRTLKDCLDMEHEVSISLQFTLSSSINSEPMLEALREFGVAVQYDFSKNLERQMICFDGENLDAAVIDFPVVVGRAIPHAEELTEAPFDRLETRDGIVLLMVLLVISHKMHTVIEE